MFANCHGQGARRHRGGHINIAPLGASTGGRRIAGLRHLVGRRALPGDCRAAPHAALPDAGLRAVPDPHPRRFGRGSLPRNGGEAVCKRASWGLRCRVMIDTIKKTILAGIGAAAVTKDKVQAGLEDLVRQGKITAEEARATAERIAREGKREFDAASEKLGDGVRDLLARVDGKFLARIEALEARVDALEGKTAKASKPRPKA